MIFEHVKFEVPFRHPSGDIQKAGYMKVWSSCDMFIQRYVLDLSLHRWCRIVTRGDGCTKRRNDVYGMSSRPLPIYGCQRGAEKPIKEMEKQWPVIEEEKREDVVSQKPSKKSILTRSMLTMSNVPIGQYDED